MLTLKSSDFEHLISKRLVLSYQFVQVIALTRHIELGWLNIKLATHQSGRKIVLGINSPIGLNGDTLFQVLFDLIFSKNIFWYWSWIYYVRVRQTLPPRLNHASNNYWSREKTDAVVVGVSSTETIRFAKYSISLLKYSNHVRALKFSNILFGC